MYGYDPDWERSARVVIWLLIAMCLLLGGGVGALAMWVLS